MITCFFENNNKALKGLRHVTVNAIVVHDNKILLGQRGMVRGKRMSEFGKWGMVGGFLDRDETLVQGLNREVFEETGCEINKLILFHIKDSPNRPKEDRQNVEFVFIAHLVRQIPKKDEEVTQLRWFSLENLPQMEEMAFDHGEDLLLYKEYLKKNHPLPLLGY